MIRAIFFGLAVLFCMAMVYPASPVMENVRIEFDGSNYVGYANASDGNGNNVSYEYVWYYGNGSKYVNNSMWVTYSDTQNTIQQNYACTNSANANDDDFGTYAEFGGGGNTCSIVSYYNTPNNWSYNTYDITITAKTGDGTTANYTIPDTCLNNIGNDDFYIKIQLEDFGANEYSELYCNNGEDIAQFGDWHQLVSVNNLPYYYEDELPIWNMSLQNSQGTYFNLDNETKFDNFPILSVRAYDGENYSSWMNYSYTKTINVHIYDRDTENLLTQNVSLQLVATDAGNQTTDTGYTNFSLNTSLDDQYKIIANTDNYDTEEVVFTYSNTTIVKNVSLYMLNSTASNNGLVRLVVKDSNFQLVQGAVCTLLEWKPSQSAFVAVAYSESNADGQCYLNVELETKLYEFQVTYNGLTKLTPSERIYIDGDERTIILPTSTTSSFIFGQYFNYTFTQNITDSTNTSRINFYSISIQDDVEYNACIRSYSIIGNSRTQLNETCVNSTTVADMEITYYTNNSYILLVEGYINYNGIDYEVGEFRYREAGDIFEELAKYELLIFIPMLLFLLGVGLALTIEPSVGLIVILIGTWLSVRIAPTYLTGTIAGVFTFIICIMLWAIYRRKT